LPDDTGRVPKIVPRVDASEMRSLPLAPVDGFLLSRIDGKLSQRELGALTGLSDSQVSSSLEKLEKLRVISFGATPAPQPTRSPAPAAVTPPPQAAVSTPPGARPTVSRPPAPVAPSAPVPPLRPVAITIPDDAPELEEEVDLELEFRRRVLSLHEKLPTLNYYQLLGVDRSADRKAVKRAYFELAAIFHPDKYFRKELGSFKLRMETIFGRVTQAYDALINKEGREEYDQYLADLGRTQGIDAMLQEALDEMRRAESDAVANVGHASVPPTPIDANAIGPAGHLSRPPQASPSERNRRDALAMRLMAGRSAGSGGARSSTPAPAPAPSPSGAVDALKRRYEDRIEKARKAQAQKYLELGREAEAKSDVVAAANAYKVALSFATEDAELKMRADAAQAKADEALFDTYLRQAQYEERSEAWADAAKSWARVAKAHPADARAHDRTAHALMRAAGDLHVAAQEAQRACALAPGAAEYKITLANVYLSAGLTLNAKRELEAAAQLSPGNDTISKLMKRVHKAG
jgi:curved DNA-binding protein CbpA